MNLLRERKTTRMEKRRREWRINEKNDPLYSDQLVKDVKQLCKSEDFHICDQKYSKCGNGKEDEIILCPIDLSRHLFIKSSESHLVWKSVITLQIRFHLWSPLHNCWIAPWIRVGLYWITIVDLLSHPLFFLLIPPSLPFPFLELFLEIEWQSLFQSIISISSSSS